MGIGPIFGTDPVCESNIYGSLDAAIFAAMYSVSTVLQQTSVAVDYFLPLGPYIETCFTIVIHVHKTCNEEHGDDQ